MFIDVCLSMGHHSRKISAQMTTKMTALKTACARIRRVHFYTPPCADLRTGVDLHTGVYIHTISYLITLPFHYPTDRLGHYLCVTLGALPVAGRANRPAVTRVFIGQ
jgi:hypothetical protein